ncbi:hypothetical protein ED733_008514 [Metarhizium rileyi]|uniref:F-box domain-containing protein n=1 Tax=Metarhizium rileyi (strain RCEF 4871) TaxID=1649241 RepID=A0A5C6GLM4_METRR|nr:hypothetical protein ED733_008514 [Metarhizium rileyi]
MEAASLASLPDDLLLDIIEYLDTARDTSHLGRVSSRTHQLVERAGWKTFVKTRFPSLRAPCEDGVSWSRLVNTFSYLDRCWDRRALQLSVFRSQPLPRRRDVARHRQPRQAIDFHGIVDAHHVPSSDEELVVWGAGEDLHVRRSDGSRHQTWRSVLGTDTEYAPGTGDVTCLKMIERRAGVPEIVVGRANGDVQVLSAAKSNESFGRPTRAVIKLDDDDDDDDDAQSPWPFRISPGRRAVTCTDWQPDADMLATCRSSRLHLYKVEEVEEAGRGPLACHDMARDRPCNEESLIRDVKFLGDAKIAVALGGSSQPVRFGSMRPTGVDMFVPPAPASASQDGGASADVTNVWSMQPVGHARNSNSNLLLSSWHDGSFRLMDVRTPSPHDAVYRDTFQPYHAGGPLLVYGTERFVSGNSTGPTLRFFDFRYPKPYLHSAAEPCSPHEPLPRAVCSPRTPPLDGDAAVVRTCDPGTARRCTWHAAMQSPCYRQDTTLWLGHGVLDRVFSLAKASDTSDCFYLGLRGAVAEAQLVLEDDIPTRRQKRPPCPAGWKVSGLPNLAMADTGISLCTSDVRVGSHGHLHSRMPEMLYHYDGPGKNRDHRQLLDAPDGTRFDTTWRQQVPVRRRGDMSTGISEASSF